MTFHSFVNFLIVLFHMGRSRIRMCFLKKDQIASGEGKRNGQEGGMGGESQNEGYICEIPIIKHNTNFISQIFGQTSNHYHCNGQAQKP